jgi:hypothetical protein
MGIETALNLAFQWNEWKIILISFLIASLATLSIAIPLRSFQERGIPSFSKSLYVSISLLFIMLCGFSVSGSSGFILTWIYNNHTEFVQKSDKHKQEIKEADFERAKQKALVLHDFSIQQRFVEWFTKALDNYSTLVNDMEVNVSHTTQLNTFDAIFKGGSSAPQVNKSDDGKSDNSEWGAPQTRIIEKIRNHLMTVRGEIEGGKTGTGTGRPGYGQKAMKKILELGQYFANTSHSMCNKTDEVYKQHLFTANQSTPNIARQIQTSCGELKQIPIPSSYELKARSALCKEKALEYVKISNKFMEKTRRLLLMLKNSQRVDMDMINVSEDIARLFNNKYPTESITDLDSRIEQLRQIDGFKFQKTLPKTQVTLHKLARAQLLSFLPCFEIYHIPPKYLGNIPKNIADYVKDMSYEIYFSKKEWIETAENRSKHLLAPTERVLLLGIIAGNNSSYYIQDTYILDLPPKMHSAVSKAHKSNNHFTSEEQAIAAIQNNISNQKLEAKERLYLSGLITKRNLNFNDDYFPLLIASAADIASIIMSILIRLIKTSWEITKVISKFKSVLSSIFKIIINIPCINWLIWKFASDDMKKKIKEEKALSTKRFKDFMGIKTSEWNQFKEDGIIKWYAQDSLLKEMQLNVATLAPAEEYKELIEKINEINKIIEDSFQNSKKIRENYANEAKELQEYLLRLKILREVTAKNINEIKMDIEKVALKEQANRISRMRYEGTALSEENEQLNEKATKLLNQYRRNLKEFMQIADSEIIEQYKRHLSADQRETLKKISEINKEFMLKIRNLGI